MTTPALTNPTNEQIAQAALPAAIVRKCNDAQINALGLVIAALDDLSGWCRNNEVMWATNPRGPVLEVWPADSDPNDTRTMLLMFDEDGDVRYAEDGEGWESTQWFTPTHADDAIEKLTMAWSLM